MNPTHPLPPCPTDDAGLELVVDKATGVPAYLQLKRQLECAIREGRLAPGAALPSERALAASLELSRMTVRRSFEALAEAGIVEQRHGSGTFVRGLSLEQPLESLVSYSEAVRLAGFEPGSELITVEQVPASDAVARALRIEVGTQVLHLLRLRTADGEPLELQDVYLPPRFLDLSIVELTHKGSLYDTLDTQYGVRPLRSSQWVGARLATPRESRYLRLTRDVPVLSKERLTLGLDERPIEYVLGAVRSDRYRMLFQVAQAEVPG